MDYMTRRSIRKYQNKPVEKEKIDDILKAALVAPTGMNTHSTRFIVIDDRDTLEFLSTVREHGSSFIKNAPLVIGVLGEKDKSTTLVSDCSIAAFAIQMRAHELGLGSCWVHMQNRKSADGRVSEDIFRERLNIPDNIMVMCMIGIGYPDEKKPAHTVDEIDYSRVSYNKFQ